MKDEDLKLDFEKEMADIQITSFDPKFNEDLSEKAFNNTIFETIVNGRYAYFRTMIWAVNYFLGVKVYKWPTDLWIFQEIVWELKPDVWIETGTYYGGGAWYIAHLFDGINKGKVITIDKEKQENLPEHPRIQYISGDSVSEETIKQVNSIIGSARIDGTIVVNLDSDHMKDHVLKEMELYSPFVSDGSYMIVEDGILGHPVWVRDKQGKLLFPGPQEAIHEFLKTHKEFTIDKTKEKHLFTSNPNGYLRKNGKN